MMSYPSKRVKLVLFESKGWRKELVAFDRTCLMLVRLEVGFEFSSVTKTYSSQSALKNLPSQAPTASSSRTSRK